MGIVNELRLEIEAFQRKHSIADSRIGLDAMDNPKIVRRIKDGKPIDSTSFDKIRDFIRSYRGGQ